MNVRMNMRLVDCDDGRDWDVPRRGCCRYCDREFPSPRLMPEDRLCARCYARIRSWPRIDELNHPLGRQLAEGEPPWHPDGALDEQRYWHIDLRTPCRPLPEWARFPDLSLNTTAQEAACST